MSMILGIDPGPHETALVQYDADGQRVVAAVHESNERILEMLSGEPPAGWVLAIERIRNSYGRGLDLDTCDTIFWAGRFAQAWAGPEPVTLTRQEVLATLTGNTKCPKGECAAALRDLHGGAERAVGTAKQPGPLWLARGNKGHCWDALAVAVAALRLRKETQNA